MNIQGFDPRSDRGNEAIVAEPLLSAMTWGSPPLKPSYKVFRTEEKHRTALSPAIDLFGIPLLIHHGEDAVHIESPQWPSLRTFGETTQAAINEMIGLIRRDIEEFILASTSDLSKDAVEYRNFLIEALTRR